MILNAPAEYDRSLWQQILAALGRAVEGAFAKGSDVELARGERLILRSPDGSRWVVGVDNAGAIDITGPL